MSRSIADITAELTAVRADAVSVSTYDATRVDVSVMLDVSRVVGDGVISRDVARVLGELLTRERVDAALRGAR